MKALIFKNCGVSHVKTDEEEMEGELFDSDTDEEKAERSSGGALLAIADEPAADMVGVTTGSTPYVTQRVEPVTGPPWAREAGPRACARDPPDTRHYAHYDDPGPGSRVLSHSFGWAPGALRRLPPAPERRGETR